MPKFLSELPIEPLTHQASIRLRHRVCVRTYVRRTERAYVTVRRPSVVRTESGVEVEFGGRELRARFGGIPFGGFLWGYRVLRASSSRVKLGRRFLMVPCGGSCCWLVTTIGCSTVESTSLDNLPMMDYIFR